MSATLVSICNVNIYELVVEGEHSDKSGFRYTAMVPARLPQEAERQVLKVYDHLSDWKVTAKAMGV